MGQRMPPVPHIYGDDCPLCFEDGKTPKYMWARFSGMSKCLPWLPPEFNIPPNDRAFKLTQNIENPCKWTYLSDAWGVDFEIVAGPVRVHLTLGDVQEGTFYFDDWVEDCPDESTLYNNDHIVCIYPWGAAYGIATVTWTQEATNLLESINLERADDLFMELRPLADGNKVYKFCRLKDATNIAIEFEPD